MKRTFKTTKKLSGMAAAYRPWREWEVGDVLIGRYKGSKTDNYDKPNWLFEVLDAQFSDGKAAKKLIGKTVGLNSNGKLDKAMEDVTEGDLIQVTYNGMGTIEKGKYKGKEAHDVEVDMVVENFEDDGVTEDEEEIEDDEHVTEDDL